MKHLVGAREILLALMDLGLLVLSCVLLYFVAGGGRRDRLVFLEGDTAVTHFWVTHFALLIASVFVFLIVFGTYKSLWAYATSREYLSLIAAAACGYLLYIGVSRLAMGESLSFLMALETVTVAVLLMLALRMLYRRWREYRMLHSGKTYRQPLILVGAGDAGALLLEELARNTASPYRVLCVVDDDPKKIGRLLHGCRIEGPISRMGDIVRRYQTKDIIITMPSAGRGRLREVVELCSSLECKVRILPDVLETVQGASMMQRVREVSIDDLLGRDPISLHTEQLTAFIQDKVVMVTGGGGSIGSELCRQIARHRPKQLIVVDIYENNAYDIEQELRFRYRDSLNLAVEIASVRDEHKINLLFQKYRPQLVFHAAAHKHVPLMEHCPEEAVRNNVFGTYHVASAADRFGAERFILISTDKAVNPTNVMGASKRLCEMVMQSFTGSRTRFAAVRFGNVLGSNGSVIPLFRRQIAAGGPITLTDKRIIRYFMTIPEAAQLVLSAGAMAQRGEIFVLDMGQPVRIAELAENLVRLSGLKPYRDIDIVETGLRPGEKLYEELLMHSETLRETDNSKIFIEQVTEPVTPAELQEKLAQLTAALETDSAETLVETMHRVVPTFHTAEEVNARAVADLNYHAATAAQAN